MAGKMRYAMSGIVCLANDLKGVADAIQAKRVLAGDDEKSMVTFYPSVPSWEWYTNSRLIIVAHGNPESTLIIGDMGKKDAEWLANWIPSWLGYKIERISLHMCFSGGNRGAAVGTDSNSFTVHPSHSFGYKFASYCSFANSVTTRTDVVGTQTQEGMYDQKLANVYRSVGQDARHKGVGDKVIFLTDGGTPKAPKAPKMQWGP